MRHLMSSFLAMHWALVASYVAVLGEYRAATPARDAAGTSLVGLISGRTDLRRDR